jgi:hypothetical protein
MTRKSGRNADGTFAEGNASKLPGTSHRITRAVTEMLYGQAEAITRNAIDMALDGDATALRLCLWRIAPPRKNRPVGFELPAMTSATDAAAGARSVL